MVTNITSLTGNGLKDWLIQRVSALYFAGYALFLCGYLLTHPMQSYGDWSALFHCRWVQAATAIALISFVLHAWIGIWTVTTDYIKCTVLRLSVQLLVVGLLLGELLWGFMIMWGR